MSAWNAGDLGSIPGSGRSPEEGNSNPLQYSCLENPMDGGAWWAAVHGVTKSRTRPSDFTFTLLIKTIQFNSVAQSCPTFCDPMNCSTPGLPVHPQLPEFTQTHIHQVSDPSSHLILCCPLLLPPPIPPSIRVFSKSQLFT